MLLFFYNILEIIDAVIFLAFPASQKFGEGFLCVLFHWNCNCACDVLTVTDSVLKKNDHAIKLACSVAQRQKLPKVFTLYNIYTNRKTCPTDFNFNFSQIFGYYI